MTTDACRHWRELLGAYVLGHLATDERVALEAHVDGCSGCRAELDELRPVAGALPEADPAHLGA
ncbi:MAG: anti-sigma factor family protein, partial [Actinomycetota bacterium]